MSSISTNSNEPLTSHQLLEIMEGCDYPHRLADILRRAFGTKKNHVHITGTNSLISVSYMLSNTLYNNINILSNVIVVDSLDQADALAKQLRFFRPDFSIHILPSFDVSPYSSLYPSPATSWMRCDFLYWASHNDSLKFQQEKHIFIATVAGLLQKTAPFYNFHKRCQLFKTGNELPSKLAQYFNSLGYQPAPVVEDKGQYSIRGGIVDIFSTAEKTPIRLELFGDQIESIRTFSHQTQLSLNKKDHFHLAPVYEFELSDENLESVLQKYRKQLEKRPVDQAEKEDSLRSLTQRNYFPGCEYVLPYCYEKLQNVTEHFSNSINILFVDPVEIGRMADEFIQTQINDSKAVGSSLFHPQVEEMYDAYESIIWPMDSNKIEFANLAYLDQEDSNEERLQYSTSALSDFSQILSNKTAGTPEWLDIVDARLDAWESENNKILISIKNQTHLDRIKNILNQLDFAYEIIESNDYGWNKHFHHNSVKIFLVMRDLPETAFLHIEKTIFLRDDDFLGKKQKNKTSSSYEEFSDKAKRLSFGDLKLNDLVVHVKHGVGVYEGLKIMNIGGVDSEYIQVAYKDKDKLYLPVYRVGQLQKYSGSSSSMFLDKLGGQSWEKVKIKVKNHLRDIASELLQLYAKRSEITRPRFIFDEFQNAQFENAFPYEETNDQMRAIREIQKDFSSEKPMDRLVCGDVGFGKTEVAMRAAFEAVTNKKQVAVLAPTTVLTFQHLETFKKRFHGFDYVIRSLNRFVSTADAKQTLKELKEGKVDILIGTHRLFSKDVQFNNLGLLIIDEEQKFGVLHKEKIKKLKINVDTLTLSATPIPRTLNMSFTGLRDLSIINTAPVDRLPTRTFVSKFDPDQIRKAISAEISRGGQVYFIHNRVQSIYGIADQIRSIIPEARIKVAHGQMEEHELEEAMLAFFAHEIDVLICTAIVESGMDVPRANTMFIDQAHMFGLSQLYQLRGRVGRSKTRAYCYLLTPKDRKLDKDAIERLKIIQDNSALGSGIKIAQYDLELRGAGNLLGDDQSGHVNSVGYEMYMDLLNEALAEAKGEDYSDYELDPEINLKIPALIPDAYISDIRVRLSYYKALSEIKSQEDLDNIENELRDQFGQLPEQVVNLMGLMLIRRQCKNLGVRDISAGLKNISLIFTDKTKLKPEKAIELTMRANKKYSLTPDQRLNVRLNTITWSAVYDELQYLLSLV
jgi:transcription-repair coupling factor (superfamily II helicase)